MREQSLPVLIIAQSGRFLAQSAAQAGHTVWAADCFGDNDTLAIADRYHQLPPLTQLNHRTLTQTIIVLANDENCLLVCGTGVERFYPILSELPENIKLLGNPESTIRTIKSPPLFFALLAKLVLPFPITQFSPPKQTNDVNWLYKENSGLGGTHIQFASANQSANNGYFQQYIEGDSGSVLFLANGKQAHVLAFNRQQLRQNTSSSFVLKSIQTPYILSKKNTQLLTRAVNDITKNTGLVGLNSLDFIINNDDMLFVLEVNPRPSASCELIANEQPVFKYHSDACHGSLPPEQTTINMTTSYLLHYLYAPQLLIIPENMVWPDHCHDIPSAGTIVQENHPICTIVVEGDDNIDCHLQSQTISNTLIEKLFFTS